MGTPGMFLIGTDQQLVPMSATDYPAEDDLQELIAKHPDMLAGDQITPGDPRRWILVRREQGVPRAEAGGNWWSLDHLFIDQDGVPTLVEVKRRSDGRARREVVAQMLDYAANGTTYWTIAEIRQNFDRRCEKQGRDPLLELQRLTGKDANADAFWNLVGSNLKERRIRMIFAGDEIAPELLRIVEFLADQMTRAEIVAVEIRQYTSAAGERVLAPRMLAPNAAVADEKRRAASGRQPALSEDEWLVQQGQKFGPDVETLTRSIIDELAPLVDRREVSNTGYSLIMMVEYNGRTRYPIYINNGQLKLQFAYPGWTDDQKRELIARLNGIDGVRVRDNINGEAGVKLALLANTKIRASVLETFRQAISMLRAGT